VRDGLRVLGAEAYTEAAELGVSELVANACLHAGTPLTVELRVVSGGAVRIEVTDQSSRQPEASDRGLMATGGRGLRLLSAYGVWGVDPPRHSTVGKTVWFQPARNGQVHPIDKAAAERSI
jgi:hypothetical protein